jgi:membrane glycosyltransferase
VNAIHFLSNSLSTSGKALEADESIKLSLERKAFLYTAYNYKGLKRFFYRKRRKPSDKKSFSPPT